MALTRDDICRALEPIARRLRLVVSRGILAQDADDSAPAQRLTLDLLSDEQREGIQRVQQYGLTSRPPEGAEAICLSVGGVREHLVAVAVDATGERPTDLDVGEVGLWIRGKGLRVRCLTDGTVEIGTSPTDFVALAPAVKSELDAIKSDLNAIKNWANAHTHPVPQGNSSAPSSPLSLAYEPGDVAATEVKAK